MEPRGRIAQARPLPGPAENVLATAGSAVGEDCFEAPQIRLPSGVLFPQVADHSLGPAETSGHRPAGPLGGTGMSTRARYLPALSSAPAAVSHLVLWQL